MIEKMRKAERSGNEKSEMVKKWEKRKDVCEHIQGDRSVKKHHPDFQWLYILFVGW